MSIINQTLEFYTFEKKEYEKPIKQFKNKKAFLMSNLRNLILFLNENENTIEKMKCYKKFLISMHKSIELENYHFKHNNRKFTVYDMRLFLSSFEKELNVIDESHFESFILGYINALYQLGIGFFGSFFEFYGKNKRLN